MPGTNGNAASSSHKRGTIVDRDPANMRVKMQFGDEDDMVSMWIDVLASSTTGTTLFMMPALGEEAWCALDANGEDGCLLGSKYNSQNKPSHASNDDIALVWGGGAFHLNTASGAVSITSSGAITIKASSIALESATLTHNGVDIGHEHKHKNVTPGPSSTGTPV